MNMFAGQRSLYLPVVEAGSHGYAERPACSACLLRSTGLLDAELRDLQERVTAHLAAIPGSWGVDCDGVTGPGGREGQRCCRAAGRGTAG